MHKFTLTYSPSARNREGWIRCRWNESLFIIFHPPMNFHVVRTFDLLRLRFLRYVFTAQTRRHSKNRCRWKPWSVVLHFDYDPVTKKKIYEGFSCLESLQWKISAHFPYFFFAFSNLFFLHIGQDSLNRCCISKFVAHPSRINPLLIRVFFTLPNRRLLFTTKYRVEVYDSNDETESFLSSECWFYFWG